MLLIQQALHGYIDGHQLIAASTDLARNQESLMLVMSDLSGPAFRSGYEAYITGYPVPRQGVYCIAKTWFAPEQLRPGCVWTHTLLVRDEELARIPDVGSLRSLFRRPRSAAEFEQYEVPISYEPDRGSAPGIPSDEAGQVIRALYSSAQCLVIPADSSYEFEDLVLAIFSQQWPKLRRGFRFCTGALSIRSSEFDLSVSPPDATHSVGPNGLIVRLRTQLRHPVSDWVSAAVRDLGSHLAEASLRKFLWQFGPDYSDGRASFRPLTEIWLSMQTSRTDTSGEGVLSAVAYFFPQQKLATRLKAEMFGRQGKYSAQVGSEPEILRLLISHPRAESLPSNITQISDRAAHLAAENPDAATDIALLALNIGSESAQQFLEGYTGAATSDYLTRIPASLIVMILDKNPALVATRALWQRPDNMELMSGLISRGTKSAVPVEGLITALIEAEAWRPLRLAMDYYRSDATTAIFAWIDSQPSQVISIPQGLFDVVGFGSITSTILLESGKLGLRSLAVLTSELDPRSSVVRHTAPSLWLKVTESRFEFADEKRTIQSSVFLLCIGLSSWDPVGGNLISFSFSMVYQSAKENSLSTMAWEQLEPNLPWYSPSWDRCARLVRAVARGFHDRRWPIEMFCSTFKTREQLGHAVAEIDRMWNGSYFLRRLKQDVLGDVVRATQDQLEFIESLDI
jgi:hypothetical protein